MIYVVFIIKKVIKRVIYFIFVKVSPFFHVKCLFVSNYLRISEDLA